LYSGLFLGLPYDLLQKVGRLLPLFADHCTRKLAEKASPTQIVESFFTDNSLINGIASNEALFLFLQLAERQVVLFDALEDAAFADTHDLAAPGSVTHLLQAVLRDDQRAHLSDLLDRTATRVVLTAHPTQFYPDTVQAVIQDLRAALVASNSARVEELLLQLGKTRFSNRKRPSPVDEARSVLVTLEEVFYEELPRIVVRMLVAAHGRDALVHRLPQLPNLQVGFWPGGDRDGNPFVTPEVTRDVANLLKEHVLERHLATASTLIRRLTFDGVHERMLALAERLKLTWLIAAGRNQTPAVLDEPVAERPYANANELLLELVGLRDVIVEQHQGLFVDELDAFIAKVHLFGFHFASIDLRQSSDVCFSSLCEVIENPASGLVLTEPELASLRGAQTAQQVPIDLLERLIGSARAVTPELIAGCSPLTRDTLDVLRSVLEIQDSNGELGLHRFVISHTRGAEDALVVLVLARLAGLAENRCALDVVPLFESIQDLQNSESILRQMLDSPSYRAHLAKRRDQIVMVGFSDGTKDGGYLAANWNIREAKRRLTALGRSRGVQLVFFDGRGGPPARGGGNTHQFYRSRDAGIEQLQNQLTIQGQTISSNFGSRDMGRYHIEQLYTANLENLLFPTSGEDPPARFRPLVDELSTLSHRAYRELREDQNLLTFLDEYSPLPLFDHLTFASRPVARRASHQLELGNLRAIPFVATFSVLKIQIPGYYGLGAALGELIRAGRLAELEQLYRESRFFRALLENAAMSLLKSRFDITAHLERDERFGPLWRRLRDEAMRVEQCLLRVSHQPWLLYNDPLNRASIRFREDIVLPLLVIVHHAVGRYNEYRRASNLDAPEAAEARRMALKGIAAVINATRNAA
jgi:phosphoenolpyruvate carboxylase